MQTYPYQEEYLHAAAAYGPGNPHGLALEVDKPSSFARLTIEVLFYLCLLSAGFLYRFGLHNVTFLGGGVITVSGLCCISFIALSPEKFPLTFWIGCIIWVGANVSQVIGNGQLPFISNGPNLMLFFICQQMMAYFVCQNAAGRKRLLLFLAVLAIVLVGMGGEEVGAGKVKRLAVTETGGLLSNSNSTAYVCSFLAVALLFWSLRAAKFSRPLLWIMAAVLTLITIRTLSRTGILLLIVGMGMLLLAIASARGARIGGFVLLMAGGLVASQFAYTVADSFELIGQRFGGEHKNTMSRLDLYDLRTIGDLVSSTPFGFGPDGAVMTSTGITAHNTFIYIHMAYGAITAWPLIIWQILLGVRVIRLARIPEIPMDTRLMVVTFYGMIFAEYLTNNVAFLELSALYGTGVIEAYTAPYSRAAIARREQEADAAWQNTGEHMGYGSSGVYG